MSPNNKKKLNQIRKKLDKLDNKLINLIKIRKSLVDEVIKQKQFKKEIIDKKRIKIILKRIKKKSINNGMTMQRISAKNHNTSIIIILNPLFKFFHTNCFALTYPRTRLI